MQNLHLIALAGIFGLGNMGLLHADSVDSQITESKAREAKTAKLAKLKVRESSAQELTKAGSLGSFTGDSKIFSGKVKVSAMFKANAWRAFSSGLVEFDKGARSAWHTHPAGQTLIVTESEILTGTADGKAWLAKKGDVISCPPNIKHFHGASTDTKGVHIALTGVKDTQNVKWLELVSDEEYKEAMQKARKESN
ncbi:4-carboxymuconolactone decarboxylase [Helicobacter fennelliae]|uniref:4-carboxymuconolactone decarboxylase n=1 Tax=Helicobacter fennelliae TaxID=215 RepID=A0A2X3DCV2_9HELI|nr:4-carboxymuconolactone decarboxylase [Helicobacter fennelliae]